jgi:hypothetical protein
MKLRIRGDSVRLRLTEPEARALAEVGYVEETVRFPGAALLRYRVETGPLVDGVHAGLVKSCLWVRVSREAAARWASGAEVTISGEQSLAEGGVLRVSVEKDFECLHPGHAEHEAGAYAHPAREIHARVLRPGEAGGSA